MRRSAVTLATMALFGCSPHVPPPKVEVAAVEPGPPVREPLPPKQPPTTTTWTTLSIAPGCELKIADSPASLGPPLAWKPCRDGPDGCLEVPTQTGDALAPNVDVEGVVHGEQTTIAVLTMMPGPTARYVLAPRDGLPFFAVEGPRDAQCSLGQIGLTDDGAVVEVVFDNDDGYASRAYLRGPLADDPAWRQVAAVLPRRDFPQFIGESVMSVGGRVVVLQSGGPLRWYDGESKRWVEIETPVQGWQCCASGRGDAVLFSYSAIPETPMAARIGVRAHRLRRAPVDGTSPIMIDGAQAVWIEGRSRDNNNYYKAIDLWRGDVVDGPEVINPRKVMSLPHKTMVTPSFGGGMVAVPMQERAGGKMLVRLDAQERLALRAPSGLAIERLLWLSRDEVAVRIGPNEMGGEPSVVRRIPVAALPPWTEK